MFAAFDTDEHVAVGEAVVVEEEDGLEGLEPVFKHTQSNFEV